MIVDLQARTVTERALVQRLNRKLRHQGERMSFSRRDGVWYVVDDCNCVTGEAFRGPDLLRFARDIGVAREHERLARPSEVQP